MRAATGSSSSFRAALDVAEPLLEACFRRDSATRLIRVPSQAAERLSSHS